VAASPLKGATPAVRQSRPGGVRCLLAALVLLVSACANTPPPPDWAVNAQGASERSVAAYLRGDSRIARVELERARREVSATAAPERLARLELLACAAEVASLEFNDCSAYRALAAEAAPAEQAYARYLMAAPQASDLAQLPEAQRPVAQALLAGAAPTALPADPLARLLAAGVLLRAGRASPALLAQGVDTASTQGWRRPVLAWLEAQARAAEAAGDLEAAQRARRRAALAGR
jgi:hypothetical protein